ncbi:MAG TPA: zinc ribbon domain-containing protein [Dehalococcoidia bacterium]|jgi:putative FmdB family regulatory protein|nr:zinc ribbon domain-containing protein [Dehalococcoidia bacterium]
MPIYEYVCADCDTRFEELRAAGRMDDPASCPQGHPSTRRVLSTFAALARDVGGDAVPIGGGGCSGGSCGGNCACSLN